MSYTQCNKCNEYLDVCICNLNLSEHVKQLLVQCKEELKELDEVKQYTYFQYLKEKLTEDFPVYSLILNVIDFDIEMLSNRLYPATRKLLEMSKESLLSFETRDKIAKSLAKGKVSKEHANLMMHSKVYELNTLPTRYLHHKQLDYIENEVYLALNTCSDELRDLYRTTLIECEKEVGETLGQYKLTMSYSFRIKDYLPYLHKLLLGEFISPNEEAFFVNWLKNQLEDKNRLSDMRVKLAIKQLEEVYL